MRREVEDFNERVIAARYRLPEGPPLVTMPRDVDATVAAWRERRTARAAEQRRKARSAPSSVSTRPSGAGSGARRGAGWWLAPDMRRRGCQIGHTDAPHRAATFRAMTVTQAPRTSSARWPSGPRAAPRDPGAAEPGHPLLRPEQRRRWRRRSPTWSARSTSCSATSRTPSRPTTRSPPARAWCEIAQEHRLRRPTQLWTRVNALDSPWVLDDLTTLVAAIGDKLDVIMVPKVQGAEDIHYVDRLLAQLEAKAGPRPADPRARDPRDRPRRRQRRGDLRRQPAHAGPLPRPGRPRRGPPDEDHPRRRRPPRLPGPRGPAAAATASPTSRRPARRTSRTCGTTRSPGWSTPARCTASTPTTARSATSPTWSPARTSSATPSCSAASAPGRLHPKQIAIANQVFSPSVEDVAHARRVVAAMGDGTGAVMLDGKMEDDASLKQCLVMVELAEQLAAIDPELEGAVRRDRGATPMSELPPRAARCSTCRAPTSAPSRRRRRSPATG